MSWGHHFFFVTWNNLIVFQSFFKSFFKIGKLNRFSQKIVSAIFYGLNMQLAFLQIEDWKKRGHRRVNSFLGREGVEQGLKFCEVDLILDGDEMLFWRDSLVKAQQAQEGFRFDQTEALIAKHSEAQTGCPVTYVYTKKSLAEYIEKQGFETKDVMVDHIFPYFIPDYVKYIYRREWYFAWIPAHLFRTLEKWFGWHVCITGIAH